MKLFQKKSETIKNIEVANTSTDTVAQHNSVTPANKSVTITKSNSSNLILKYVLVILLVIVLALVLVIYYLSNVRVKIIQNNTITTKQIEDSLKSKAEVEKINLRKIPKKAVTLDQLESTTYTESNNTNITGLKSVSPRILKASADNKINNLSTQSLKDSLKNIPEVIPVIFSDKDIKITDYKALIQNIILEVQTNKYSGVDIDYSIVSSIDSYSDFIKELSSSMKVINKKLDISILPRWSSVINYSHLQNFTGFYARNIEFKDLANYVDEIRVHAYIYTTTQSSLPGQIAPVDWVEQVIQYNINLDLPREKTKVVINTYAYQWNDQDIAEDFKHNYVNTSQQAVKILQEDLLKLNLKTIDEKGWDESAAEFTKDNNKYILIYPTTTSINKIKQLVADYGLKGYILY